MAGEGKGWISLYRSIQDHWLWQEKPFDKARAWIDLLLLANHQDKKVLFDGTLIEVKRGQFITSIRKLCDRWGWSNSKVKKFLEMLESDEMITYKSDTKKTTINIVKYYSYQTLGDTKSDTETSQKHRSNDAETSQKHTNNNDNNENNVNKDNNSVCLGEFQNVILKKSEYEKLINTHTQPIVDKYVDKLSDYMESEGKKYKSHYATIKRWIKSDKDKMNNNQQKQQPNKPKDEYGYDMAKIRKQLLG